MTARALAMFGLMRLVVLGCAAACAHTASPAGDEAVVSGSVAYRERMALPPDAVVEVKLLDVSLQDVAAPVIAETTVLPEGRQVPLPFELRYDPTKIQPNRSYAVRATIVSAGRMIFTTDTAYPVITQGNPAHVDLWLVRVSEKAPSATSGNPTRVDAIRAALADWRTVQGARSDGDNSAAWTAYFDGATLRYIDEKSNQGDYGTAQNEYYFENGVLFAYVSRATLTITDPSRPAGTEEVTLSLGFDGAGGVVEQSKTVGGRSAPVESAEASGVKARAALLAEEAVKVAAPPVVRTPPAFRAPPSHSGRLVLAAGNLRFIACGKPARPST